MFKKSGYNMYRGWTQTDYQNKHYNINQKDKGTQDDQGRDGGTNFTLRIKEQETRLTLHVHDDDDDMFQFRPLKTVTHLLCKPTNTHTLKMVAEMTETSC